MRAKQKVPSVIYLGIGFLTTALFFYSASTGGKMVYEHGVGVRTAGRLRTEKSPEIGTSSVGEVPKLAFTNAKQSASHLVEHLRKGDLIPAIRGSHPSQNAQESGRAIGDGVRES